MVLGASRRMAASCLLVKRTSALKRVGFWAASLCAPESLDQTELRSECGMPLSALCLTRIGEHGRGLQALESVAALEMAADTSHRHCSNVCVEGKLSRSCGCCGRVMERAFLSVVPSCCLPVKSDLTETLALRSSTHNAGRGLPWRSKKSRCDRFRTAHCRLHSRKGPFLFRRRTQPSQVGEEMSNDDGASCINTRGSFARSQRDRSLFQLRSSSAVGVGICP
mmetsp:Transcript_6710/g.10308  ORF Transcript_6710/g.10308 Transcript_6710/m.10308 type:complete len:223 (+) Transcript_6710:235-903(+)